MTARDKVTAALETSKKAIPLFPLELRRDSEGYVAECPACDGNGYVEDESTWDTQKASGIQAFGIGVALEDTEDYIATMNPEFAQAVLGGWLILEAALESAEADMPDCFCSELSDVTDVCPLCSATKALASARAKLGEKEGA